MFKSKIGETNFQFFSKYFNRQEKFKIFRKKLKLNHHRDSNDESCDKSFTSAITDRRGSMSDLEQLTSKNLSVFQSPFIKEKKLDPFPVLKSAVSAYDQKAQNQEEQNDVNRKIQKQGFQISALESEIEKIQLVG